MGELIGVDEIHVVSYGIDTPAMPSLAEEELCDVGRTRPSCPYAVGATKRKNLEALVAPGPL